MRKPVPLPRRTPCPRRTTWWLVGSSVVLLAFLTPERLSAGSDPLQQPAGTSPVPGKTSSSHTPSAGTQDLLNRLEDDNPHEVVRALVALGMKGDLAAFVPIVTMLQKNLEPDVRAAAMATLEKLDYTVPFLVGVLEDDTMPAVAQAYAAYTLGRMQAADAVPALIAALESPHDTVREHAMTALGAVGDMRAWKPLIVAAHKDPSPALRVKAQETVEKLATAPSSAPDAGTLNLQLQDPNPMVRRSAARALSTRGNWWSVPLLAEALKDPDEEVRRLAARALGDLQDRRAVAPLTAFLPSAAGRTLYTAIVALGVLRDPAAVPALIPYLDHPDPEARRYAARALGTLGDPSAGPGLRKLLADPLPRNRQEAARALGLIRDTDAVEALETIAVKDNDEAVRYEAIRALGGIGDPGAVSALERLLFVKDTIAVVTVINALRTAVALDAVPILEDVARKHREQWVREEALQAAVEIRGRARRAAQATEATAPKTSENAAGQTSP